MSQEEGDGKRKLARGVQVVRSRWQSGGTSGVGTSGSGYLRVDSGTGIVTESKKPVFFAKFNAFSSGASRTNPASNYQTPAINIGSHFNSSNGVFTAPVAGTYIFFGSLLSGNNIVVVRIYFEKNGSIFATRQHNS